ncbi:MAG: hypothetical protein PHY15_00955 [Eubacteriales bacterium]|nr:hypothetical protein [Eubacteriales bacterium]MDD4474375.1 hypothetical protein [Eubacteriales bacterium]
MELRAMTPTERMYIYAQSSQISRQTGLIGHLRADMDTDGQGFFSTWFDYRKDLKTDSFKTEFDEVMDACRFSDKYGHMLGDRELMKRYCCDHPDAGFEGSCTTIYGFRIDTDNFAYLLRLNPQKGDYNLYCYCYRRDWLDSHLQKAERGILFITPNYDEKFRILDGDKVRVTYYDGETKDYTCRYIDDYHVEVGDNLYHICELAERMEQNGNKVIPLRSSLPEQCYSTLATSKEIIILKRGESGYYRTDIEYQNQEESRKIVDACNAELGVTKAQEEAMKAGSMFGFEVPGADPKNYNDNGKPLKLKHKDRDDVR